MGETQAKVVFSLMSDSPLIVAIGRLADKCKRYRPQDSEHSAEYWCEEMLARGINAFDNYLDSDFDRRNREAYVREMSKLSIPNPENAEAMANYALKVASLQRKFRIGGQQAEV